jgi:hypothetical protein
MFITLKARENADLAILSCFSIRSSGQKHVTFGARIQWPSLPFL